MTFNYADVFEQVAQVLPADAPALIHDGRCINWQGLDQRANRIARQLQTAGLQAGDKVAFYLTNGPAYSEVLNACFKARFTHVNVNYRYVADELFYILDNSDSRAVFYSSRFASTVQELHPRLADVLLWVEVCEPGDSPVNDFALHYESAATEGDASALDIQRDQDDLMFIYTGGTTGMPKGVMWEHGNMWQAATQALFNPTPTSLEALSQAVTAQPQRPVFIPVCPQMHGTGMITTINMLSLGGCVVSLQGARFDADELWGAVQQHRVTHLAIVGDAFARPMLQHLRENEGKYDISSLTTVTSSGVMWSPEIKQGLLEYNQNMVLVDTFGASEAIGFGSSVSSAEGTKKIARFAIGERCKVFTEDLREVVPGSDEMGFIARSGPIPKGYYKDPEKTAKIFVTVNGVRYSMPGDWCRVAEDGTLTLIGRGSVCINTAGEKVFPEEVEEVLKTHPAVEDALVVGVPDEKWGQAVVGVVQPCADTNPEAAELQQHVRQHLSGYKTPKHILYKPDLQRAVNGKADYKGITEFARASLER